MMSKLTAPKWCPTAVITKRGWQDPKTGEVYVANRRLFEQQEQQEKLAEPKVEPKVEPKKKPTTKKKVATKKTNGKKTKDK
jgi:uncharacterized protein (DUF58 family)